MSTRISSAYDQMIARIAAVLTSHARLPNAYAIEKNIEPHLALGYAVAIGPASGSRLNAGQMIIRREFSVTITRRFQALQADASTKATAEKQLMEDQMLVIKDFESNSTLNDQVTMISYVSDSGIGTVFTDKGQFLILTTTFQAQYLEPLT
jgi:hypothetical protein